MVNFQPNAIITRSHTLTPTYIAVMVIQHADVSGFYERAYTRSEFELGGQGWALCGGGYCTNLTSGEDATIEPWPQCISKNGGEDVER